MIFFVILTCGQQDMTIIGLIKRRMWFFWGVELSINTYILEHNMKIVFIGIYGHLVGNP
jgi:hypothetical protein